MQSFSPMNSATDFPTFTKLVMAEFGTIPMAGLAMIGAISAAAAAAEVYLWAHGSTFSNADYLIGAGLLAGWAVVVYAVSMMLAGNRFGIVSFTKYMATAFATVLPIIVASGLLLLFARMEAGGFVLIALFLTFALTIPMMVLSGWPVLQTTSTKLIGPWAALRLTRGFRWPLILLGFALAAINRTVPSSSATDDFMTVCLLATVGGVTAAVSTMLGLSVSVAAWRLMTTHGDSTAA